MTKLVFRLKGGEGSGHFGHSGRPGEEGGSLPGKGTGVRTYMPSPSNFGEREGFDRGAYSLINAYKRSGEIGEIAGTAVVGNAGRSSLKKAQEDYPDSGFYLANVHFNDGMKKVRLMGSFSDPNSIPKPGQRMAILFDRIMTGGRGYTLYFGDVIPDDGGSYRLWFYD